MAILQREFERLVEPSRFDGKTFDKACEGGRKISEAGMENLREKANNLNKSITIDLVDNSAGRNFDITMQYLAYWTEPVIIMDNDGSYTARKNDVD